MKECHRKHMRRKLSTEETGRENTIILHGLSVQISFSILPLFSHAWKREIPYYSAPTRNLIWVGQVSHAFLTGKLVESTASCQTIATLKRASSFASFNSFNYIHTYIQHRCKHLVLNNIFLPADHNRKHFCTAADRRRWRLP